MSASAFSLLVLQFAAAVHGYTISIAENHTECVKSEFTKEHLLPGEDSDTVPTEVRVGFVVSKQGAPELFAAARLIVDVEITEPDGKVIFSKDDVHEEDDTFFAHGVGDYTMCFTNDGMRGPAPWLHTIKENKRIAHVDIDFFEPIHMIDDPTDISIPHGHQDRRDTKILHAEYHMEVQGHIYNIGKKLKLIQKEQTYLKKREARHSQTVISTNKRAVGWAFLEASIFIGMNLLQVVIMRASFSAQKSGK